MHKRKGDCDIIGCPKCKDGQNVLDDEFNRITELFSHDECQRRYAAALKMLEEMAGALNHARAAMKYAYEDHADQYYVNVENSVIASLDNYRKWKEGMK